MDIVLASASPRRKELLKKIVKDFIVHPSKIDEKKIDEKDPVKFAIKAAVLKAKDVGEKFPSHIIIGADTIVALEDKIFGKPQNFEEAKNILKTLSGTRHRVITAVALYRKEDEKLMTDYEVTYVTFKKLSDEEIEEYLKNEDFTDKAGSYAVQKVGDKFVEKIEGSYDNVVGFPTEKVKKMLEDFSSPEFTVEIVDVALPNNWGVGKSDNFIIFVPDGVYGDKVRVKISKKSKNFSFGEIIKIEEFSPFRKKPECPHFGSCGGCIFQNLTYEKQLEIKENYLIQSIKKIGWVNVDNVEIIPIIPSPKKFYYRNKMEFAFGESEGKIVIGLRERSSPFKKYSKDVTPLKECLIFSEKAKKIFSIFTEFANSHSLSAYNPFTHKGFLRHLVLREGKRTSQLMILLVTTDGEIPDLPYLGEEIVKEISDLKSFYWIINNQIADVVSFEKKNHLLGKSYIEENIGDMKFKIYPQTFFQPNTDGAEILYNKIVELGEFSGNEKVLGLYCGAGIIEIFISKYVREVAGIDSNPVNIFTAKENCMINGVENCIFYEGTVEKVLKKRDFSEIDIIITDPPRNGMSGKAIRSVIKIGAKKILYVSCNPSTFARDVKIFEENGYKLKKLCSFDFFPHTAHMEILGVIEKVI